MYTNLWVTNNLAHAFYQNVRPFYTDQAFSEIPGLCPYYVHLPVTEYFLNGTPKFIHMLRDFVQVKHIPVVTLGPSRERGTENGVNN